MSEFAQHGYAQASTNKIVQEAGIAKGVLFYYFKNKQELFNYLIDYVINYIEREYLAHINYDEPDFLERHSQAAHIKMQSYIRDPQVFEFLGTLYIKQDEQIPEKLWTRLDTLYRSTLEKMLANVDTSLFRPDVTPEYIFKMTAWVMDGYQNELIAKLKDKNLSQLEMKPYWDEFYEFLAVLRTVLYRQEEVNNGNSPS